MAKEVLLHVKGVCKSFPGVKALNNVELELYKGEILALLGENGAGKSTLLKILSGAYTMDAGEVILEGQPFVLKNPDDAYKAGISIIYQELNYINELTVAENIFMGCQPHNKFGMINKKEMYEISHSVMQRVGLELAPGTRMGELTVSEKQLVEIAKALNHEMKILIMDEPTSSLNEEEVASLMKLMKNLVNQGKSIIFISHRIEELFMVADRVTVLRDGINVGTHKIADITTDDLIALMVGRTLESVHDKECVTEDEVVLKAENITTDFLKDVSLNVRKGEILGIYGLMGAGCEEVVETLFGIKKRIRGTIEVKGSIKNIQSPRQAMKAGLAYVPAERKTDALVLMQTVRENATALAFRKFSKFGYINFKSQRELAQYWIDKFSVKTPSMDTVVESLSGGNQQKVVLSKWIETKPDVLILNDPTRGIDVGAKQEIYKIIKELCREGMAIILVSTDMRELFYLSDRIIAMSNGRKAGEISAKEASQTTLMRMIVGENV